MKVEEESEDRISKTLKTTDRKPTGEGEPGPEAGTPQQEPCKVFSLTNTGASERIARRQRHRYQEQAEIDNYPLSPTTGRQKRRGETYRERCRYARSVDLLARRRE